MPRTARASRARSATRIPMCRSRSAERWGPGTSTGPTSWPAIWGSTSARRRMRASKREARRWSASTRRAPAGSWSAGAAAPRRPPSPPPFPPTRVTGPKRTGISTGRWPTRRRSSRNASARRTRHRSSGTASKARNFPSVRRSISRCSYRSNPSTAWSSPSSPCSRKTSSRDAFRTGPDFPPAPRRRIPTTPACCSCSGSAGPVRGSPPTGTRSASTGEAA